MPQFFDELAGKLEALDIKILRKSELSDVDCYTSRPLAAVAPELEALGLIVTRKGNGFIECLFAADNRLLPVEVATTLFRGAAFRHFQVKQDFVDKYVADPQGNDGAFRIVKSAVCLSRLQFLSGSPPPAVSSALTQALEVSPYKDSANRWDYSSRISLLLHNGKISSVIDRYATLASNILSHWKSSRTCAIVGPDGAGKSTIIAALTGYDGLKTVYMGMREFSSEKLIRRLQKIRYFSIPFVHGIIFVEYWCRVLKAYSLRLRGFDVVFDRYPTFDYLVSPSGFDRALGRILYKFFFPRPQRVFMLTAPAADILKRKNEMTAADIGMFYKRAEDYPVVKIENTGPVQAAAIKILRDFYGFQK